MRKLIIFLIVLTAFITPAQAEDELSLTGILEPAQTEAVTAPFAGTIERADIEAGDSVAVSSLLFELSTTKVYAPCDGTVAGLRAREGDSLVDVSAIYPAPMYVEPTSEYIVSATTSGAYDDNDNRYIHVGEHVYLTSKNNHNRTGEGIITSVSGTDYTVEVQSGSLRLNENCRISRDPDSDETDGRIGSGKTERNNPVAVAADGNVLKLCVSEGTIVKKGDLLMEVVQDDLRGKSLSGSQVLAADDLIIQSVRANVGDSVQQGQVLATTFPVGSLIAVMRVDESDLQSIAVGDNVTVELDCTSDGREYRGTVDSIAFTADPDATSPAYEMTVSFENDDFVRQGMSVTVRKGN